MTDDKYVQCRTLGHQWVPMGIARGQDITPALKNAGVEGLTQLQLHCDVCHTWRFDYIRRAGTIFRRKYVYPDGYLMAKGEERPTRVDFRLRMLKLGLNRMVRK